ncbi:uncharacterized protein LAESUDRAFT_553557 [Laetiporus sulphureus 93-53]|uniref:Uncharacterized protein n=1 Tax=Laetiporus sulphureus 93-53 TaxID=1314785 RepID=A0A165B8Z3_9APHY|nr:uncharacterized protein LAESUDRAFT_553557 [Laetiporus sulphureus 93-53]KZT00519.1 hypothetical protein LAESUDRAFT_553557 [Laetiporus sulphureus 93-53]
MDWALTLPTKSCVHVSHPAEALELAEEAIAIWMTASMSSLLGAPPPVAEAMDEPPGLAFAEPALALLTLVSLAKAAAGERAEGAPDVSGGLAVLEERRTERERAGRASGSMAAPRAGNGGRGLSDAADDERRALCVARWGSGYITRQSAAPSLRLERPRQETSPAPAILTWP